ncbi:aquaporin-like [Mytilus trossulus]|uniref:aquaporin-like n=1 Tax=Mytilus trossulus TaxID=6551 RepID=UPI003003A7BA
MLKIMKQNLEDLTSPNLWRAVAAEMVGTIFLVFLGCGAHTLQNGQPTAVGNGSVVTTAEPSVVQISLTFGLVVGTMIWCIAHISGGHINPAVTVAALITRRVSVVRAFFYIVAQIVGAIIGAAILIGLTPESQQKTIGLNSLRGDVTDAQGFGVELMITFVVVLTVLASLDEKRTDLHGSAPLTIGLAVALGHLFAVSYTGCSLNPARSFGPAVVKNSWENHWVFWIGPLVGGSVAAILYEYFFSAGATFTRTKKCLTRSKAPPSSPEKPLVAPEDAEIIEIEEKKEEAEQEPEENEKANNQTDGQ